MLVHNREFVRVNSLFDMRPLANIRKISRSAGASYFAVQNDWDFPGNDLSVPMASSYADCASQCTTDPACKAFTMFKDTGRCCLKSSIGGGGAYKEALLSAYKGGRIRTHD